MATIREALAIALQHHQAGHLQAAEGIYRQILQVEPQQADALHLLGVIAHQVGKQALAVEYIGRAIAANGNSAGFHNSLGNALKAEGKLDEAVASYRRALELKPDFAEAHNNLGTALNDQGKLDEAIACYRRALALNPAFAETHLNLGVAFKAQGQLEEAVACYRRALALNADYAEAHSNLGNVLREQGKPDEAIACYRRAVELKPDFVEAYDNLGHLLRQQGKREEAVACCRQSLALKPDCAEAHNNLGVVLQDQGQRDEAVASYRRALALKPDYAEAHNNLGVVLQEQGKLDEAIACWRQALELNPDFAEAYSNLGIALMDQGKPEEAVACCRRALALRPHSAGAHNNLGVALKGQGQLDEALTCWRRALELNPDFGEAHGNLGSALQEIGDLPGAEQSFRGALRHDPRCAFAHYQLAELLRGALPDHDLAAERRLLAEPGLTDAQRLLLHFGLAQTLDARGEYAEAAAHLARANALQLAQWRARNQSYDPQAYQSLVTRMIELSTPDFFERVRGFGVESELPVFIVGLPRSGTTLIEQILASHPQVFGAGEIGLASQTMAALGGPEVDVFAGLRQLERPTVQRLAAQHLEKLREFSPTALRIVDKRLENYLFLGLLTSLFPRAKFIHCRRDVRDVAVSCWMTYFREVRWANDQGHIASRFCQYQRIMEHWRKVLPRPLLEVDYEETVADLEGVARRVVAWCGLEWEPQCLEFYRTDRAVSTASAVQVRQPLFQTSLGRWKHYEGPLASLFASLERPPTR